MSSDHTNEQCPAAESQLNPPAEPAKRILERKKQAFLSIPRNSKKDTRLAALLEWNQAAETYFIASIATCLTATSTEQATHRGFATGCLKAVADHYESVFAAAAKLGQNRVDFEPALPQLKHLQEIVQLNDPHAADDLFRRFVRLGLPTYGLDRSQVIEEAPKRVWIPALCIAAVLLLLLGAPLIKDKTLSPFAQDMASRLFAVFAGVVTLFMSGTALFTLDFPTNKRARLGFSASAGLAMMAFVWVVPPYWFTPNLHQTQQSTDASVDTSQSPISNEAPPWPQPTVTFYKLAEHSPNGRLALDNDATVQAGDSIRCTITSSVDAYVCVLLHNSNGATSRLLLNRDSQAPSTGDVPIRKDETLVLPAITRSWRMDHHAGREDFYVLLSSDPFPTNQIDDLLRQMNTLDPRGVQDAPTTPLSVEIQQLLSNAVGTFVQDHRQASYVRVSMNHTTKD